MKPKSTTLLLTALLATSSAFGVINVHYRITQGSEIIDVSEFNYGQTKDSTDDLNGNGDWQFSGNDNGVTFDGQAELTNAALGDNVAIANLRMIDSPAPLIGKTATHGQLFFSVNKDTTLGDWEIGFRDLFGSGGRSVWETFNLTSDLAGTQIVWTFALTEDFTGVDENTDGSFNLTYFGTNGFSAQFWNQTGDDANVGVTFEKFRFITVPEPATYGLILGGLLFGYIMIRRRNRK